MKFLNFTKSAAVVAALSFTIPLTLATDRITHNPKATNTGTIMHAWSWSFPEIARNMKNIADAGFTMVQTSPVQECFFPEGSGKKIFDENVTEGNWYYYYQPTDWKIGNPIVGTRQEMVAMMESAKKYNVDVIVDVLPNHVAFDIDVQTVYGLRFGSIKFLLRYALVEQQINFSLHQFAHLFDIVRG